MRSKINKFALLNANILKQEWLEKEVLLNNNVYMIKKKSIYYLKSFNLKLPN